MNAVQTILGGPVTSDQGHDLVAVDHLAALVADHHPVRVAVEGYADVGAILLHRPDHGLGVGRPAFFVDIHAVGRNPHRNDLGAEFIEGHRRDLIRCAIGAIDHDPQTRQIQAAGKGRLGDFHIARLAVIDPGHPTQVSRLGEALMEALIHQGLNFQFPLIRQFVAAGAEQLDPVVGEGVVRGRNHHAEISAQGPGHHGHARGRHGPKQTNIHAHAGEAGHQGGLNHIAGQTGILADHHHVPAIIPGHEELARRKTDPQGDLSGHGMGVGLAANAVRAEIRAIAHGT